MNMFKTKKIILPGIIFISSFYSVLFTLGLIFGYCAVIYFFKKMWNKKIAKPIFLNFGKWQIHLHHWLLGLLALCVIGDVRLFHILPKFFLGFIGGIICHDLYFDKEWYKVVLRKPKIR